MKQLPFLIRLLLVCTLTWPGLLLTGCEKKNPCHRASVVEYTEIPSQLEEEMINGDTIRIFEENEDIGYEKITIVGKIMDSGRLAGPGRYQVVASLHTSFETNPRKLVEPSYLDDESFVVGDIDPYLVVTGPEGKFSATLTFQPGADLDFYLFAMENDGECGFYVNYTLDVSEAKGATDTPLGSAEEEGSDDDNVFGREALTTSAESSAGSEASSVVSADSAESGGTPDEGSGAESSGSEGSSALDSADSYLHEVIELSNLTPYTPYFLVVEGFALREQTAVPRKYKMELDIH